MPQAREMLARSIHADYELNSELSIVEACMATFGYMLDELRTYGIRYISSGNPEEFTYAGLSMMVLPELAVERPDGYQIFTWRTGSARYRSEREARLRAGGLTCWARVALRWLDHPIKVTEAYLREAQTFDTVLSDAELTRFVDEARDVTQRFGASARIRDFPAQPAVAGCRFCDFQTICPEYASFYEADYDLEALARAIQNTQTIVSEPNAYLQKRVFLSHVDSDKQDYVRPFARLLESEGISYWLDEAEIFWGDSLMKSINTGLAKSDYVMCFISPSFLGRGWPEGEMGAALSRELGGNGGRVLPVLIADPEDVFREYPLLRDKKCELWSRGPVSIVASLKALIERAGTTA